MTPGVALDVDFENRALKHPYRAKCQVSVSENGRAKDFSDFEQTQSQKFTAEEEAQIPSFFTEQRARLCFVFLPSGENPSLSCYVNAIVVTLGSSRLE